MYICREPVLLEKKMSCVMHIKALEQALGHGLIMVLELNQKAWLKPYVDMNTELRTKAKNNFEKESFEQMNNSVIGKTMENVRSHRYIKCQSYLVSEPNYQTAKCFLKKLLVIEMKKMNAKMNKSVYLGLSILDISKIVMYQYWYD